MSNGEGWEELFSGAHGGRPYYHHSGTGATQWAEPAEHRTAQEQLDADVFALAVEDVRRVMRPLRTLQSDAERWPKARALLLRVTGNVVNQPGVTKFRSVNAAPGSSFAAAVCATREGCDLMAAIGFVGGGGEGRALVLPQDAPLGRCRLAHFHINRSTTLTGGDAGGGSGGTSSGFGRWNNHACSVCSAVIHSGQERLWTTRWDAPRGQFRYRCNQCRPEFNLCERCWDRLQRTREPGVQDAAGGGGDALTHDEGHTFEHVHPIESRHNTTLHGDGPWGNFSGSVSARSRERLRDRTGL